MASAVGQAPIRCAQPAPLLPQVAAAIEPGHLSAVTLGEGRGKRPFRFRVAHAFAWENRHCRDSPCCEFIALALDSKYRPAAFDRDHFGPQKTLVRGERQDQPAAVT